MTTPRRMKQPIKDELRRQLTVAQAEAIYLQEMLDRSIPAAIVVPAVLIVGMAFGALAMWLAR